LSLEIFIGLEIRLSPAPTLSRNTQASRLVETHRAKTVAQTSSAPREVQWA